MKKKLLKAGDIVKFRDSPPGLGCYLVTAANDQEVSTILLEAPFYFAYTSDQSLFFNDSVWVVL